MSAPIKRHASFDDTTVPVKISSFKASLEKLNAFVRWSQINEFNLSKKVTVGVEGSCAQYGMVATDDIEEGELLFQIPRSQLITPNTSAIADLLEKGGESIKGSSGWAPVLIALMYEYTNPDSHWRPYLDLVPDFKELDLPMFWPSSEREDLLAGTKVVEAVDKDVTNMETEFKQVVLPFVEKHGDKFSPQCKDLAFYKKMVAFVMAYSFTDQGRQDDDDDEEEEEEEENPPPMMVPMADILNHVAKNNAHLNYDKDALRMVAVKPIKKGEEVFNTYGELANWDLLHMYGFSESYPNNHFDTVDMPTKLLIQAAKELENNSEAILAKKQDFIENFITGEDGSFTLGVEGVLSEEELCQAVRVLLMTEVEFTVYQDNEGWTEDEGEESLSFETIPDLPESWKKIICCCAELCLGRYKQSLEDDRKQLQADNLTSRQIYSLHTTYGQKKLLQKLINVCQT